MYVTVALWDFIHDRPGRPEGACFSRKRNTEHLGLQHHHQAHMGTHEHGLKAKGSNHFPESSCATTPFYRKANRRHMSIDRLVAHLQPEGDPRVSRPCALSLQAGSSVPPVTERRMCLPSEGKDSLCWLGHPPLPSPPHASQALGAAAALLLTSVRKHRF